MKSVYIFYLLFVSSLSQLPFNTQSVSNEPPTSQISHILWEKKSLGTVSSIHFINAEEVVTSSKEGIISHINITSSEVSYRKFVQESPDCSANEKFLLCAYQQGAYAELFNVKNGQLLQSVDMPKDATSLSSSSLMMKKGAILNVVKSKAKMKILNDKGVLFESKGEENVYDYFIDEAAKTITVLEGNTLKQLPTTKLSKSKLTSIANVTATSFDVPDSVVVVSKERVFHLQERKVEVFDYDLKLVNTVDVLFDARKDKVIAVKNSDIIVLMKEEEMTVISKEGKVSKTKLPKRKYAHAVIDSLKETTLFIALNTLPRQLTVIEYDLSMKDLKGKSTVYALDREAPGEIQQLSVYKNLLGVSFGKTLIVVDSSLQKEEKLKAVVYAFHHEYNSIVFSELIAYSNDLSNLSSDKKYFTTFENMHQKDLSSVVSNTVLLVAQDIKDLVSFLKQSVQQFLQGKSHQKKKANPDLTARVLQSLFLFTEDNELIVLDGSSGKLKFRQAFKGMTLLKIIKPNYKTKILQKAESVIELVFSADKGRDIAIFEYNLLTNSIAEKEAIVYKYELQLKQLQLKMIQKDIAQLITKEHANLPLEISVGLLKSNYHNRYSIEQKGTLLYCFKYTYTEDKGLIISIVWNMRIEGLLGYHLPTINDKLIPTYLVDGKIFFKYITENLVLGFSKIERKTLLLSILQAQTGRIIKQISIPNIDYSSLQYLYEDNWGIISYVKIEKGFKRNEIFAIELLKGKVENSLLSLIDKYFKSGSISSESTKEVIHDEELSILTKTFILSRHVKSITKSESEFNNANKFIVLLLENNQTFLIDRRSFSPRRPMMKNVKGTPTFEPSLNSPYVDPELPGYNPIVTLDHKFLLDPTSEGKIDSIVIAPSQHESTFLLCSIGHSIGCYSVFPDKTFDALSSEFDYNMIGFFLFACISIVYFLRKYAKRREFTDKFLTSIN